VFVDDRKNLKLAIKKWERKWTGWIRLRIGTNGGLF
jgi:hypothetical protein